MLGFIAFFVQLDAQTQVVGRIGLADGFIIVDGAGNIKVEQVLVESLHAVALAARHQVFNAHQIAFEYQVLHGRCVNHQIDNSRTPFAAFFHHKTLADNAHQVHRQINQYLFMPLFGIQVHDTFDGLVGRGGVDGEDTQVAGLRQLQGVFHTIYGTHLTHTDYIRRLTHRTLHGNFPIRGIDADFALGNDGTAWNVQVFDRVFDGDDVAGQVAVAVVKHGRHRSGFTRTGGTGQNQQAALLHDQLFQFQRQGQVFHRRDIGIDAAHYQAAAALLVIGVDTVTHVAFGLDGIVDFQLFCKIGLLLLIHGGSNNFFRIDGG